MLMSIVETSVERRGYITSPILSLLMLSPRSVLVRPSQAFTQVAPRPRNHPQGLNFNEVPISILSFTDHTFIIIPKKSLP